MLKFESEHELAVDMVIGSEQDYNQIVEALDEEGYCFGGEYEQGRMVGSISLYSSEMLIQDDLETVTKIIER